MTTKSRILSLVLSLLMIVALFAPMALVTAEGGLKIVKARDNGGTQANSTAKEAIEGLGSGTSWYSANRTNLANKTSHAIYTLKQSAFVDGVEIAFYFADQRKFDFSVEYSMDNETFETALPRQWSTQQSADKTAEYFAFPEQVEALYLQVTIYDAKVVATGGTNNYGAFYTFEAFGEFDPEGIIDPSTVAPEGQVWCESAYQVQGPVHTNFIYRATAAAPNLRESGDVWFSANASGDAVIAAVYRFELEADLYEIQLDWYKGENRTYEYALYFSTDNRNWTEVMEPGSESSGATDIIECEGSAVYVKIVSADGLIAGDASLGWFSLSEIRFYGDFVEGGQRPVAKFDAAENWINIQKDLHEDLYTPESWKAFDDAINAIDFTTPFDQQDVVDAAVEDIREAFAGLTFVDTEALQIAQSYWYEEGSDYNTGETAWTYGSIIFTTPGYTLDQYRVNNIALTNWYRIFAVPTAEAGVYEISNIIDPTNPETGEVIGAPVTADEMVPENEYGIGFVIAFYTYNDGDALDAGTADSQYASVEFGMRNAAAYANMELAPGDKVQLNNIIFTEEQFAEEGEDMQAAWLETEGEWKHRYWDTQGLGEFTPTPIYRQSNKVNTGAAEGEPQYLARDQFEDFVSYSTMTKIVEDDVLYGDADNDGVLGIGDVTAIAMKLAGWDIEVNVANADADGDGTVGIGDVTAVAMKLAGWDIVLGPQ